MSRKQPSLVVRVEALLGKSIPVARCPKFCDNGYRGMDACNTCGMTGSVFYVSGKCYENTEEGWIEAHDDILKSFDGVWKHKKTGRFYVEVCRAVMQYSGLGKALDMVPVVVYRAAIDGTTWVRPVAEFEDGRFERVEIIK